MRRSEQLKSVQSLGLPLKRNSIIQLMYNNCLGCLSFNYHTDDFPYIIPVAVPSLGETVNVTGLAIIPAWITTHTSAAVPSVVENIEL